MVRWAGGRRPARPGPRPPGATPRRSPRTRQRRGPARWARRVRGSPGLPRHSSARYAILTRRTRGEETPGVCSNRSGHDASSTRRAARADPIRSARCDGGNNVSRLVRVDMRSPSSGAVLVVEVRAARPVHAPAGPADDRGARAHPRARRRDPGRQPPRRRRLVPRPAARAAADHLSGQAGVLHPARPDRLDQEDVLHRRGPGAGGPARSGRTRRRRWTPRSGCCATGSCSASTPRAPGRRTGGCTRARPAWPGWPWRPGCR